MISIKNLSKNYGSNQVLKDLNLNLERGHVYGFVGKNGAGKTTLFNCIAAMTTYDGQIDSEFKNLKNHIGLLETNPIFLSRITGWEYLKLLCQARKISDDDFNEQNIFELPLNDYVETYSTGMKKKLALMGILLQKNEVFILDEPFNGVDIQSNILIGSIIEELRKKKKIVLISSHIFSTLSKNCDKIFLLNEGSMDKGVTEDQFEALESALKKDIVEGKIDRLKL